MAGMLASCSGLQLYLTKLLQIAAFSLLHVMFMRNPQLTLSQTLVTAIVLQVGIDDAKVKAPLYIRCHALAVTMRLLVQGAAQVLLLLGAARVQFLATWNSLVSSHTFSIDPYINICGRSIRWLRMQSSRD